MSDKRNSSNGTVDQMIGNMTSDIQNADGRFIRLGFTPPPATVETLPWNLARNQYPQFNLPQPTMDYEYNTQPACNYAPQNVYNNGAFDVYNNTMHPNGVTPDDNLFSMNYRLFLSQTQNQEQNFVPPQPPHTQLIENLVGNWVVPNTNGMYSPFGNAPAEAQTSSEPLWQTFDDIELIRPREFIERQNVETQFQFSRDNSKPRVVAEVKPMRPSYSDVLLKSAPASNVKVGKSDNKENKQKKESKKGLRNEKTQKVNSVLNRSNTSNDIKDISSEKNNVHANKATEKATKTHKSGNLNRKWASMDNVTESFSDLKSEAQKNRNEDVNGGRQGSKGQKKGVKVNADQTDTDSSNSRNESVTAAKSLPKKGLKNVRAKNSESFGNSERPPGKRGQRFRKRDSNAPFGVFRQKLKHYLRGWWKLFVYVVFWLVHLVSDICSLSVHLSKDMMYNFCKWFAHHWSASLNSLASLFQKIHFLTWIWRKIRSKKAPEKTAFSHSGLQHNINMPTTGEDAMKRLLACKGKDPYSILGVTTSCTDDDIKRYYKRQAFLVHPDKNQQPGAEEAFKILVHAFDMIGEPERRASYDRGVAESAQVEQAWSELNDLLEQLQQKVEAAANTIRCSACNLRHKRIKVDRPMYAARNCGMCKIHHSAREGDIWAEARCCGFLWHYYACMEGGVYDITEWAGCQKESLKHLRPDSHHVQYRIALGKQNGQARRHSNSPRGDKPPDLENLLNSLYGQSENGAQNTRRRNKKNK